MLRGKSTEILNFLFLILSSSLLHDLQTKRKLSLICTENHLCNTQFLCALRLAIKAFEKLLLWKYLLFSMKYLGGLIKGWKGIYFKNHGSLKLIQFPVH